MSTMEMHAPSPSLARGGDCGPTDMIIWNDHGVSQITVSTAQKMPLMPIGVEFQLDSRRDRLPADLRGFAGPQEALTFLDNLRGHRGTPMSGYL